MNRSFTDPRARDAFLASIAPSRKLSLKDLQGLPKSLKRTMQRELNRGITQDKVAKLRRYWLSRQGESVEAAAS